MIYIRQEPKVIEISTDFNEEIPKWDVALEALLKEEYQQRGRALNNDDFLRLARQYAIRFDDIMATLFELAIARRWVFAEAGGEAREITPEKVAGLYAKGRLNPSDLEARLAGCWRPLS